jgi:hypothetical protein
LFLSSWLNKTFRSIYIYCKEVSPSTINLLNNYILTATFKSNAPGKSSVIIKFVTFNKIVALIRHIDSKMYYFQEIMSNVNSGQFLYPRFCSTYSQKWVLFIWFISTQKCMPKIQHTNWYWIQLIFTRYQSIWRYYYCKLVLFTVTWR